ncbi:hypothetical protein N9W89_06485 [Hellea sp.]|nr:hypothetical protein [Hellea sp.]
MTLYFRGIATLASIAVLSLTACSQNTTAPAADTATKKVAEKIPETAQETVQIATQGNSEFEYMFMDKFEPKFSEFVGLVPGESFDDSKPKIDAVFTAYDGHAEPLAIRMEQDVVEAGWTQVLVTQDGLMDGTVAGQQLLAIYDENGELVSHGMRIKCHKDDSVSEWQNTACE